MKRPRWGRIKLPKAIVLFHSRKHISSICVNLPLDIGRSLHATAEFRSSFHLADHVFEVVADLYGVGVEHDRLRGVRLDK